MKPILPDLWSRTSRFLGLTREGQVLMAVGPQLQSWDPVQQQLLQTRDYPGDRIDLLDGAQPLVLSVEFFQPSLVPEDAVTESLYENPYLEIDRAGNQGAAQAYPLHGRKPLPTTWTFRHYSSNDNLILSPQGDCRAFIGHEPKKDWGFFSIAHQASLSESWTTTMTRIGLS